MAALARGTPGIFNTDATLRSSSLRSTSQGRQFTSEEFTRRLQAAGVQIGMDGRGRVMDNLFVERLWRTVKYEEVYLRDYPDGIAARRGLERYFRFYNTQRRDQGLGGKTPAEVYFSSSSEARRPPWGAGERRCNGHRPLAHFAPSPVQLMGGSSSRLWRGLGWAVVLLRVLHITIIGGTWAWGVRRWPGHTDWCPHGRAKKSLCGQRGEYRIKTLAFAKVFDRQGRWAVRRRVCCFVRRKIEW